MYTPVRVHAVHYVRATLPGAATLNETVDAWTSQLRTTNAALSYRKQVVILNMSRSQRAALAMCCLLHV